MVALGTLFTTLGIEAITTILHALNALERLTEERIAAYPGNPFYLHAAKETQLIRETLLTGGGVSRPFYDSLNIGLMCARELEPVDMPYCDAVYEVLEQIRLAVS